MHLQQTQQEVSSGMRESLRYVFRILPNTGIDKALTEFITQARIAVAMSAGECNAEKLGGRCDCRLAGNRPGMEGRPKSVIHVPVGYFRIRALRQGYR